MDKLLKLRARLKEIKVAAQSLLDDADENNNGLMTDEQAKGFDSMMTEQEQVMAQIDRLSRFNDNSAAAESSPGRQTESATPGDNSQRYRVEEREDPMAGFANMADFASSVRAACANGGHVDDRLKNIGTSIDVQGAPTNFHKENGGTEGYMVPPAVRKEIWDLVFDDDDLLGQVDLEPTNSNSVEHIADESTPWGSSGVLAKWRSEGGQMDPTKLTENARQLKLHEMYAFVLATEELLEDAPRLGVRLTRKAAEAIKWKAVDSIMYGTGAGQPLGYFNSGALVSVAKETSQTADTINATNIAKMFSRLIASGIPRSHWRVNSDILPQLINLAIGNVPVYTAPNGGIKDAPGGLILGRPVQFTEHAKTLGDKGDIQLIDPKGYYAVNKAGGIKFDSSIHLYFDYGVQSFRWMFRLGGQPHLSAPITPANGSNTKSHFVTLDERA